jgi:hypothetical protein
MDKWSRNIYDYNICWNAIEIYGLIERQYKKYYVLTTRNEYGLVWLEKQMDRIIQFVRRQSVLRY